jgi:hypothetical protein
VLLANLEKEKELIRIFMSVLQMEVAVHRRKYLKSLPHGKSRDCGALSWRLSGAMGRVIGWQSVNRIVYKEKK